MVRLTSAGPLHNPVNSSIPPQRVTEEDGAYSRGERDLTLRGLQAANVLFARIYHHIELNGRCPLPRKGPAILVSNHISSIDPMVIQSFSPRPIRWMMAREYYEKKGMHWVFRNMGVILVDRNGRDMAAARVAMRALRENYIVGVFPEGKIGTQPEPAPFQAGIGLIALKTGAPVYPAYVEGTQRGREMLAAFLMPCKGTLSFGSRVEISPGPGGHQVEKVAKQIEESVRSLSKC